MKLQNRETGQVENFCIDKDQIRSCDRAFVYDSLTQLQEAGWEDYEEPDFFYYIDEWECRIDRRTYEANEDMVSFLEELGLKFDTEREAKEAVEKLKAWKRLKDKGFKFGGWKRDEKYCGDFTITATDQTSCDNKDLDLLFGGGE